MRTTVALVLSVISAFSLIFSLDFFFGEFWDVHQETILLPAVTWFVISILALLGARKVSLWSGWLFIPSAVLGTVTVFVAVFFTPHPRNYVVATGMFIQAAVVWYFRAKPEDADAHFYLGVAHAKLDRWQEAVTELKKAIRLKPDYADAHYNLGVAYDKLDRLQEAIAKYEKVIRFYSNSVEVHHHLSVAYDKTYNGTQAMLNMKKVERLFEIQGNNPTGLANAKKALQYLYDKYGYDVYLPPQWNGESHELPWPLN